MTNRSALATMARTIYEKTDCPTNWNYSAGLVEGWSEDVTSPVVEVEGQRFWIVIRKSSIDCSVLVFMNESLVGRYLVGWFQWPKRAFRAVVADLPRREHERIATAAAVLARHVQ